MSDNFIPLNQSTPVHGRQWQGGNSQNQRSFSNNRYQNQHNRSNRRGGGGPNRWGNNSYRNSSYGSDNSSYGQDSKSNIDAYLHPSMLQDPWTHLRQQQNQSIAEK